MSAIALLFSVLTQNSIEISMEKRKTDAFGIFSTLLDPPLTPPLDPSDPPSGHFRPLIRDEFFTDFYRNL